MSETMPLYTLCKEDLESMDKEVSPSACGTGALGATPVASPPGPGAAAGPAPRGLPAPARVWQ